MSKHNKYPPQQRPQPAPALDAAPAVSIMDALGEGPAPDVDVELEEPEAQQDPLDDTRGPADLAVPEPAPQLRAHRATRDCVFATQGTSVAVRAGKVFTEERYGSRTMDLMSRSSAFELVKSDG